MCYNTFMKIFIFLLGLLFLQNSCQNNQDNSNQVNNKYMYQDLKVQDFEQGINQTDVIILDVRTPSEYQEGHIKGAKLINISAPTFESQIDELDKSKKYYVYCRSGGRSSSAASFMIEKGFEQVYNLQGGIIAWLGANKSVE